MLTSISAKGGYCATSTLYKEPNDGAASPTLSIQRSYVFNLDITFTSLPKINM